jgi:Mitochondrial PGP phosphatase
LSVPHLTVPAVTQLNWAALREAGFQGCVFDKDNTLTAPFSTDMEDEVKRSLQQCQACFEGRVVLLSNSAGLQQFDPEGTVSPTGSLLLLGWVANVEEVFDAGKKAAELSWVANQWKRYLMQGKGQLS